MPHDNVEGSDVQGENDLVPGVTGWPEPVSALTAWYWLGAERPLDDDTNVVTFLTRALPPWLVPLRLEIIHFPGES